MSPRQRGQHEQRKRYRWNERSTPALLVRHEVAASRHGQDSKHQAEEIKWIKTDCPGQEKIVQRHSSLQALFVGECDNKTAETEE